MLNFFSAFGTLLATAWPMLLAQAGSRNYGVSWAIVLLCVVLGLIVTLKSSRRTSEVKKAREY
jgi:hypothetical protein